MMKKSVLTLFVLASACSISAFAQEAAEPWKPEQLMPPERLSNIINDSSSSKPLIIDVGQAGLIKDAVLMGPAGKKENLDKLKEFLERQQRDREIVIYCGCCPFKNCPNIRPAFELLNAMKFTNHKLLDLPHNLKMDWINHGYPMGN